MPPDPSFPDRSIVARFAGAVGRFRERIAIETVAGARLTYGELNASANRLAWRLLGGDGGRGDRVALLLPQEAAIFGALIAVLKAARIAVVLNPLDPEARHRELVRDAEPEVILTDDAHREQALRIAEDRAEVVSVDDVSDLPDTDPEDRNAPDDTAILTYTSGTTGRPKGVMQTHRLYLYNCDSNRSVMALTAEDRVILLASLSGAQGQTTMWMTLTSGARLMSFPAVLNGVTGLDQWMIERRVTIYRSAGSLFRYFVKSLAAGVRFPHARIVRLNSDKADWRDYRAARQHFPNARVMSSMGATEAGNVAFVILPADEPMGTGSLPVGRPYPGLEIKIVDEDGNACPPGMIGRIDMKGRHLANGYWRDAELTAQAFSVEPDGDRVFHSSDMGSFNQDGRLVLAGRSDATFKIRGHRVDLSEVEAALGRLPGVAAAAATAMARPDGVFQLVAFLVAAAGPPPSAQGMRAIARGVMPRHLVPAAFIFVDQLPLAASGKLDRARLRAMAPPPRQQSSEPARGETEKLLAAIWDEAFDLDGIGGNDDFFELGGDSLIAAMIAARVAAAQGVELNFGDFVDHAALRDLAAFVDRRRGAGRAVEEIPALPASRDGPIPLAPLQMPFWLDSRNPAHSRSHTRAAAVRIDGPLDVDVLRQSLDDIVERHEILRTRFATADGEPVQIVDPPAPLAVRLVDWANEPDGEERARSLLEEEGNRTFDIARSPPLVLTIVKIAENRHWLIRSGHHIISDAPSWNIFFRDLCAIYDARIKGEQPGLPPLPVQYADYAIWQRRMWQPRSAKYQEVIGWWKDQFGQVKTTGAIGYRRTRPARNLGVADWNIRWGLDPDTSKRLDQLSYSDGVTYYMVRLAAVAPVVSVLARTDTVVIGGVFTNRIRVAVERMFGLFANGVPLVVRCDWDLSFRAFVGRVAQLVVDAQTRAEIPFEQLRAEIEARGIQVPAMHLLLNMATPHPPLHSSGLALTWVSVTRRMPRNIVLAFDQYREATECYLNFDARIFDTAGMGDFRDRIVRFIAAAAREPDMSLRGLAETSGIALGVEQPRPVVAGLEQAGA